MAVPYHLVVWFHGRSPSVSRGKCLDKTAKMRSVAAAAALWWPAAACVNSLHLPASVFIARPCHRHAAAYYSLAIDHCSSICWNGAVLYRGMKWRHIIYDWVARYSRVVSVLDSGAEEPGFKSQPRRCRVTVLGKLSFTPIVTLFNKQQNW